MSHKLSVEDTPGQYVLERSSVVATASFIEACELLLFVSFVLFFPFFLFLSFFLSLSLSLTLENLKRQKANGEGLKDPRSIDDMDIYYI